MIELDDINRLEDIFDERYVKKRDCDKNIEKTEEDINSEEHHFFAKLGNNLNVLCIYSNKSSRFLDLNRYGISIQPTSPKPEYSDKLNFFTSSGRDNGCNGQQSASIIIT